MIDYFEKGFTEKQIMEEFSLVTLARWTAYRNEYARAQRRASKRQSGSIGQRGRGGSVTVPAKRAF